MATKPTESTTSRRLRPVPLLGRAAAGWLALSPGLAQAGEALAVTPAHPLPSYTQLRLVEGTGSSTRGFYPTFAVGDFKEDGDLDVVVLEGNEGGAPDLELGVSVYLQNTDGTLVKKEAHPLHTAYTTDLIAADFNSDGHLDLIANDAGNDLLILPGHGDGTFDAARYLDLAAPLFPVAADLNGDGRQDLVAGALDGTVQVLTAVGDGTFSVQAVLDTVISQSPRRGQILIADVNRDGKADVVVGSVRSTPANTGNLDVFLGNGDATFKPVITTADVPVWRGALGDFNGDGILDFAGDRFNPARLEIWPGKGDGTFTPGAAYGLSGNPGYVQTGDLNLDGILDLVVATETSNDYPAAPLSILLGNGDGTFQPRQLWSPFPGYDVANLGPRLTDFNGDGLLDVVTVGIHPSEGGPLILDLNPGVKPDSKLGFLVKVQGATGVPVALECSPDFVDWTSLATNPAPAGVWSWVDPDTRSAMRFYRTRRP